MRVVILHFSARSSGNCGAIAQQLIRLHGAEQCAVYPVAQADLSPCRGCSYECFRSLHACPYIQDDLHHLYQAIMDADLAYYILPNYADQPPAVYYAFNERSNCIFQGNDALLNSYLAVPKRFIFVSNRPAPAFDTLPQYHTTEGTVPEVLYLPPRRFCHSSLDGSMMEDPEARALLSTFVTANKKNAVD